MRLVPICPSRAQARRGTRRVRGTAARMGERVEVGGLRKAPWGDTDGEDPPGRTRPGQATCVRPSHRTGRGTGNVPFFIQSCDRCASPGASRAYVLSRCGSAGTKKLVCGNVAAAPPGRYRDCLPVPADGDPSAEQFWRIRPLIEGDNVTGHDQSRGAERVERQRGPNWRGRGVARTRGPRMGTQRRGRPAKKAATSRAPRTSTATASGSSRSSRAAKSPPRDAARKASTISRFGDRAASDASADSESPDHKGAKGGHGRRGAGLRRPGLRGAGLRGAGFQGAGFQGRRIPRGRIPRDWIARARTRAGAVRGW